MVLAVVVAQLVERSLPTPEIRGSNPNIGKVLSTNCKLNRKDENKEKEAGNGPSFKILNGETKLDSQRKTFIECFFTKLSLEVNEPMQA